MIKRILLLTVFLLCAYTGFSQSLIAKLKYEDAEAAYLKADYPQALQKLDEAEAILKASNPRTLYLRVMSQFKMIENDPYKDFTLLESTRKLSLDYLAKYETVPNNEDKFRDIYRASETLGTYPKTADKFAERAALIKAERERYEQPAATLAGLMEQFKFKLNLSLEEFKVYNPDAKAFVEKIRSITASDGDVFWVADDTLKKGTSYVNTAAGTVIGYRAIVTASSDFNYLQKVFDNYTKVVKNISPRMSIETSTESTAFTDEVYIGLRIKAGVLMIEFVDRSSIGKK